MRIRSILICGATGHLGTYLVNGLLESRHDFDVSILLRETSFQEPSKKAIVSVLETRGAKVVFVPDVSYTVEGLTESLQGFDCVVSVLGTPSVGCQYMLLEAARRAGVQRFIPSAFGFDADKLPPGVHHMWDAKRDLISALFASGLDYTIINAGVFFETFFTPFFNFDPQNKQVLIRGDPDVKMSMTSCKDIARWLPNILMDPACKNATVNVCSQVVSMREAVENFEDVSGELFHVVLQGFDSPSPSFDAQEGCWFDFKECVQYIISQGWATVDNPWNVARGERSLCMQELAGRAMTRRLPALAYLALGEDKTMHSPSHQRLVRSTNAIHVESVLNDDFPWPLLAANCG